MKKSIRLFTTVMVCMAMALCVSCKKDNAEPSGGSNTGGGGTGDHAYVDLGLPSGLLWATCNVGADTPEDYGDYFAWGETETKSEYSWNTYKWCNGSFYTLTKYNKDSDYGTVDGKTVLDPEDDAAHVNWGGAWRMPTYDEVNELYDNCTSEWTTQNGVNGRKFTGSNGNSIFLPAAGGYEDGSFGLAGFSGIYWSSSLYTDDPVGAYVLGFVSGFVSVDNNGRYLGVSVRPVYGSQNVSVPTVTTSSVSNITVTTATCGGNVTSDGGATVTARGVCWSTSQNPTASDSHTTDGSGTGSFTSNITGLTANTAYYVRAYATNSAGTSYGAERSFTTLENGGGGGGCFSVSPTTTVEFAPGNLYWDGGAFRFEANQWSFADTWNANHVSHFKWSDAANAVTTDYNYSGDLFCASNFTVTGDSHTWRTLSKAEWDYLLNSRTNVSSLRAWKELDEGTHKGLVILPDGTDASVMSSISSTEALATYGAVFLPVAGYRYGTDVYDAGSFGYYWSGTPHEDYEGLACLMGFYSGYAYTSYVNRYYGRAVRLVR